MMYPFVHVAVHNIVQFSSCSYPTKIGTKKDGQKLPIIKILLWEGGGSIAST